MVIFGLLATIILLMLGAGLDVGLFYREKTRLSKNLDSAAIRLANRISLTDAQRKDALTTLMKNNDPRWSTITWSGNTGVTPSGQQLTYTIEQFGPVGSQDAVRVTITAKSKAPVFFTRLAGINDVNVASTSVAERFPGLIVLILDVSGSMRGGTKWSNMVQGAKDFVNNTTFDETRDRMAIFIFGTRAAPIYPTPDANGNVVASKNFRTPAINALNKLYDGSNNRPEFGFNGSTSASEGVRVAFKAVEDSLPAAAADRKLFKVSYVFLTDGAFNTFRTFAVGRGYGWNGTTNTETEPATSTQFNAATTKPTWHGDKLLNVGNAGWTNLTSFNRPGVSGSTTTGPGPFNLKELIGDRSFESYAGVSTTIHAQTYTNPDGTASFGRWGRRENSGNFHWPRIWSNVIYNKNGSFFRDEFDNPIPSFNWRPDADTPRPRRNDYMMGRKRINGATTEYNILDSATASDNYSNEHMARIRWEMLQFRYGYLLSMPEVIYNSSLNYSAAIGTNRSLANLADTWLNYYSGSSRVYGNVYGSSVSTENGDARDRGIYIERSDTNGMTQKGAFNYNYWNRATARLTDFYPDYYYGSEWSAIKAADSTNMSWLATDTNWTAGQTMDGGSGYTGTVDNKLNPDHADYELKTSLVPHLGVPRYIYRPSTGNWTRFYGVYNPNNAKLRTNTPILENKNSIDNLFLDEGNFLTEAQCWIARIQHRAAVYTIAYEFSGAEPVLRRMANEQSNGDRYYNDQKRGMFRNANASTIQQVFNEIASKIGVAITQ